MHLINMLDSIESRKKYFDEMDKYSRLRELFELTENQMIRNVTNACEYMETFDYISGKDTGYVTQVCTDSQHLLDRFNKLVELSVTFDDEARDYLTFWRGNLRRAKKYWEMDIETLDAIQDGAKEDIEIED